MATIVLPLRKTIIARRRKLMILIHSRTEMLPKITTFKETWTISMMIRFTGMIKGYVQTLNQ